MPARPRARSTADRDHDRGRSGLENRFAARRYREATCECAWLSARSCRIMACLSPWPGGISPPRPARRWLRRRRARSCAIMRDHAGCLPAARPHDFCRARAAKATGCKVQTVRYYEQIGLLPCPPRSEGNQRLFCGPRWSISRRCRQRSTWSGLPGARRMRWCSRGSSRWDPAMPRRRLGLRARTFRFARPRSATGLRCRANPERSEPCRRMHVT